MTTEEIVRNSLNQEETGSRRTKKELIVVSGSSGLIGNALIDKLVQQYQVVGLDNVGDPFPPITAECVCIDLTSEESMKRSFERIRFGYGNQITSVVHLAAYYSFSGGKSELYDKITVQGTEKLLRVLKDFEVEQFIFSSSLLVYAPTTPGVDITEESALEPKWAYPKSKVQTEKIIRELRGNIPAVNLRVAGVYNEEGNSIPITHHIQRIYEKQITSYFYPGKATSGNPFIHLDDLVDAIAKTIARRKELPHEITINIGEPETLSYNELQQTIAHELHGKGWPLIKVPKPFAKAGAWVQNIFGNSFIKPWMIDLTDDHAELDISRAKTLLQWQPQHSLRKTLPKMIANLKANPAKWYRQNELKLPAKLQKKDSTGKRSAK